MKRRILTIAFAALVTSAVVLTAACKKTSSSSSEKTSAASQQNSTISEEQDVSQESREEASPSESSEESVFEASTAENSPAESSSSERSEESSAENSTEASESSTDGYYFDDEQIIQNYHTVKKFTEDEEFNALFDKNSIDRNNQTEMQSADSVVDMRNVAVKYGQIWKAEADEAYQKLYSLLESRPEEQQKLVQSQEQWISTLEETEKAFREEAASEGTSGLLAADSAILNYYKGRAAILYQQIFVLTGSFDMD